MKEPKFHEITDELLKKRNYFVSFDISLFKTSSMHVQRTGEY